MAPRAQWQGYLKLSLVSCPVALYPATTTSERVAFRQINKKTGNRLKQQLVDSVTGDVVDSDDKGRGYEFAKDQFIQIDDEELEALQVESTRTIEIDRFVPRAQIDPRYHDSPYYVVPNDKVGQDAFAVIREAMRGKDMVAIGRVVLSRRERPIMLEPFESGLRGMTLRYPYEVRDHAKYFDTIPAIEVPAEMLKLAEHILDSKAADFEPTEFDDRYERAVVDLLRDKQAGVPQKNQQIAPAPQNVINLMDALRRSIDAERKPTSRPKPKKGAEGQREMLLPIAGGGKQKAAAPRTGKQRKAG
jgi:DNA end-binding protein Ku